ncbi:LacI family DNA-binding transcriptional regulator [Paenibacillus sp. NEAU-GSW1]|uniref:LacI family DNA-binding transcriptional regulator n=1 Tax=Paenibacillus sp. NEAU-GSW1 TaxID=2682486 RepID=UPI0012E136EB|nr:LacI family DNA-binding transcriptional regulator [Paenibacillus sp. NEAU-GSW1]MUT65771.1 LacI family DNA-binding transcriptional regulator [Paenibacillus sp. NEAU-GSW1]
MKATIYDVAKEAGVSIATVSLVINGKGKISEERREEIRRIMERMGYKPSMIASALTGKKTYALGLLVPDISNPFFAEIARAVEDEGQRHGYSVFICSTDNKDEKVEHYAALLQQKNVDGVIISTGMQQLSVLKPLLQGGVPVALLAREFPLVTIPSVVVDDYAGGAAAAEHLISLGHRRLAVLAEQDSISSSRERVRGFRQTAEAAGISLDPAYVLSCGRKDGKERAMELLSMPNRPSAIFCCNDLLAIEAFRAVKESGLRIPQDCSIVGFDDTVLASVTDPPLTTIAQPIEQLGQTAVQLLVRQIAKPGEEPEKIVLRPSISVRQSASALTDYIGKPEQAL